MSSHSLPSQKRVSRKAVQFNLMLVGSSGLGKATFINTLFDRAVITRKKDNIYFPSETASEIDIELDLMKTLPVVFVPYSVECDRYSKGINFTIIDTPGFGASLNNTQGCTTILEYIEAQYDVFLEEESRINRVKRHEDSRVHAILYFISPSGLKDLDVLLMKRVGKRVNIIPVIAKADALTKDELKSLKAKVMDDIVKLEIPTYDFRPTEYDDPEITQLKNAARPYLPFAIIGAELDRLGGLRGDGNPRGRQLPWGFVEVDNPEHCDFPMLEAILLGSLLEELKENISDNLYEVYRTEKLSRSSGSATEAKADAGILGSQTIFEASTILAQNAGLLAQHEVQASLAPIE